VSGDWTNLLAETLGDLAGNGKTSRDVVWVGTADGERSTSWSDFAEFAKGINYDSGYGSEEIPTNLVVVGYNWWLERWGYDGAEGWTFKTLPVRKGVGIMEFSPKLVEGPGI